MDTAAEVPVPMEEGAERLIERVQQLQDALDRADDGPIHELAGELVSAVVQMYGLGLERIVAGLAQQGSDGKRIAVSLSDDPLVSTLLLIHDLHPVPLADRVNAALDSVRPYMESHGGDVELLGLENSIARIHLQGSCSDCSASSVTLELAIKQALEDAAPDLAGLEVEGVASPAVDGVGLPMATGSASAPGVGLPMVMSGSPGDAPPVTAPPAWYEIASLAALAEGEITALRVAGTPVVVANVDGTLLAYRDVCAACGGPLSDGKLRTGALTCRHCQRSFFLPRAGRSLDEDGIQLEPIPLLRERDSIRVALAV